MPSRKAFRVGALILTPALAALAWRASAKGPPSMTHDVQIDPQLGEALWPREAEMTRAIGDLIARGVEKRHEEGERPARRDAHPKAHGCVRASFTVEDKL